MLIDPKRSLFYLIGFMGSGKSTVGKKLAEHLGLKFYDLDILIEERARKSIANIFAEDGAAVFRAIEAEVLKDVSKLSYSVIALGGGTLLELENLHIVQQTGFLIWLDASVEKTWQRISETERRVLLERKRPNDPSTLLSYEEIMSRIQMLKQIREPSYEDADIFVDTTDLTVDGVISEILTQLDKLLLEKNALGLD